jgi:acyl-CoA hydrolase
VAIDKDGKPTPVPPLVLDTDELRVSQAAGERRRQARLGRSR